MTDSFFVSTIISAGPEVFYCAWSDSYSHSLFTGSPAKMNPAVGSSFSAWDGNIFGSNLRMIPEEKIVPSWRTFEFPASGSDTLLTFTFESASGGTRIFITHENIPEGQVEDFKKGWEDYYSPMKEFYSAGDAVGE
jgi:activator of HSP90 ATPase